MVLICFFWGSASLNGLPQPLYCLCAPNLSSLADIYIYNVYSRALEHYLDPESALEVFLPFFGNQRLHDKQLSRQGPRFAAILNHSPNY